MNEIAFSLLRLSDDNAFVIEVVYVYDPLIRCMIVSIAINLHKLAMTSLSIDDPRKVVIVVCSQRQKAAHKRIVWI